MEFKKFLGVISIFIVVMFVLMLVSSYAWYSFSNGNTVFKTETLNDEIEVNYSTGRYINISNGVPINCDDIDDSDDVGRNSFSIDIKGKSNMRDVMVAVDLVDISIDKELVNDNFKYELLYDNYIIEKGSFKDFKGDSLEIASSVLLSGSTNNDFELRVYILDNDESQNEMMNKAFKGKISVNVVSRNDSVSNFKISSIMIDGKSSKAIPTVGDYSVSSKKCNGLIEWDNDSKTIKVKASGSGFFRSCDLEFRTIEKEDLKLASVVKMGDYVSYSKIKSVVSCPSGGERAFYGSGYRVAYVDNESVYLVSSAAVSCVASNGDGNISSSNLDSYDNAKHLANLSKLVIDSYCDSKYASGGKCDKSSVWAMNGDDFKKIMGKDISDNCFKKYSDKSCGYNSSLIDNGGYYWFASLDSDNSLYYWDPVMRYVSNANSNYAYGVRVMVKLDKNVYVMGGDGSKKNAYEIGI
jgi:hypothetical protein